MVDIVRSNAAGDKEQSCRTGQRIAGDNTARDVVAVESTLALPDAAHCHVPEPVGADVQGRRHRHTAKIERIANLGGVGRVERGRLRLRQSDRGSELVVAGMGIARGEQAIADGVAATDTHVPVRVTLIRKGEELVVVEAKGGVQAVAGPIGLASNGAACILAPTAGIRTGRSIDVRVVKNGLIEGRANCEAAELNAGLLVFRP